MKTTRTLLLFFFGGLFISRTLRIIFSILNEGFIFDPISAIIVVAIPAIGGGMIIASLFFLSSVFRYKYALGYLMLFIGLTFTIPSLLTVYNFQFGSQPEYLLSSLEIVQVTGSLGGALISGSAWSLLDMLKTRRTS